MASSHVRRGRRYVDIASTRDPGRKRRVDAPSPFFRECAASPIGSSRGRRFSELLPGSCRSIMKRECTRAGGFATGGRGAVGRARHGRGRRGAVRVPRRSRRQQRLEGARDGSSPRPARARRGASLVRVRGEGAGRRRQGHCEGALPPLASVASRAWHLAPRRVHSEPCARRHLVGPPTRSCSRVAPAVPTSRSAGHPLRASTGGTRSIAGPRKRLGAWRSGNAAS